MNQTFEAIGEATQIVLEVNGRTLAGPRIQTCIDDEVYVLGYLIQTIKSKYIDLEPWTHNNIENWEA
jgi:hypothetical protein